MKKYLYFITEGIVQVRPGLSFFDLHLRFVEFFSPFVSLQSAVIFFFINEAYNTTSARNDGYDICKSNPPASLIGLH
jgi:hypothetical protein